MEAAAREFGVDGQARTNSVWSHLAAMVFVPLAHAFSLEQAVFRRTLAHLRRCEPAFGGKRTGRRLRHRFRVKVHAVN